MQTRSERFELRFEPDMLDRIDTWRSDQGDLPSRSEAVRRLVNIGLGHPEHRQLFQLARFNLLCAAKTPGLARSLSDAYVYAWDYDVYPLFHESFGLHQPFAQQFRVPPEMVLELSKYLDDAWLKKAVPSFYKIEDTMTCVAEKVFGTV